MGLLSVSTTQTAKLKNATIVNMNEDKEKTFELNNDKQIVTQ